MTRPEAPLFAGRRAGPDPTSAIVLRLCVGPVLPKVCGLESYGYHVDTASV
jgi:hypothetical protein